MLGASLDKLAQPGEYGLLDYPVKIRVQLNPLAIQNMTKQKLGSQPGRIDSLFAKVAVHPVQKLLYCPLFHKPGR